MVHAHVQEVLPKLVPGELQEEDNNPETKGEVNMAVSLNPETMEEGGGMIDDQDVTVTEARFEMFD